MKKSLIDRNRLKNFVPNPGFQERFIRSRAPIRLITAGNQSGKTHTCAWEHACYALGEHPYKKIRVPNVGFIITAKPLKEGIEKDILPKLEEVVGSQDILKIVNNSQGTPSKILWRKGSTSYLMSAEQDDVVFEGTTIDHAWGDEPFRRSIYIAVSRGMMKSGGHIFFSCTPLEEPWMYEYLYLPGVSGKNPDIEVFEGSSDENLHITDENRDKFFSRVTDDEIEARRYGKFRHLSGRVFKEYSDRNRVDPFDIPPHWPVWISIDPHRNKPHAVIFLAVAPSGHKYVCNEIYIKCTINELADHINDVGRQYNLVNILIDTSAQEDGWGRVSAREMLEVKGVRTKLAQKRNLKVGGITLINQLLHDEELLVFNTCTRTHRELTLQVYQRNKRDEQKVMEEPEKKFDDMCFIAGTMVSTSKGDIPIENIRKGDKVLTPFGFREVKRAGPNNVAEICTQRGLTGTYDHPVYVDGSFKNLSLLTDKDTLSNLRLCELIRWAYRRVLSSMEKPTGKWVENTILVGRQTIRKEKILKDFMWRSGNFIKKGKFRKVCVFITLTAIHLTTTLKTWNAYRTANILRSMIKELSKKKGSLWPVRVSLLLFGMAPRKVENGIQKIQRNIGKILKFIQRSVLSVDQNLNLFNRMVSIVPIPARQPIIDSEDTARTGNVKDVKKTSEPINIQNKSSVQELVYNLTVKDNHTYYANGVLVHNTDNLRYILVEKPDYGGVAQIKYSKPLEIGDGM